MTLGPVTTPDPTADGVSQIGVEATFLEVAPPDALSAPDVNQPGVTANANPPDTVHDVGPNHVVQMTNNTGFIVFDKQGNPIGGATPNAAIRSLTALWPAGDVCRTLDTDPIVVYDHLADRWLMAQLVRASLGGPALCIAVSQTPDPTGAWFAYTYDNTVLTSFPDYEKFGVWPDGYYMSSHEGPHGVFVFDRANMLAGAAAGFMKTTIANVTPSAGRDARILPADLDGPAPPAGTPNYFVRTIDDQQDSGATACPPAGSPVDCVEVYEAVTDWLTPSFTVSLVDVLTPAPFQIMVCNRTGGGGRDCIPQPNTANTIDALSNRPMMQLKYRNFGTHASMVFNQTIDVSGSIPDSLPAITPANEVAGIRWYELRKSGANWTIHQQGTYAPQPLGATSEAELLHRWMGSIAMDKFGSMALGYSIVNDDDTNPLPPSISYTGRRFDDLPGLMPQTEQSILVGTNTQGGVGARWGDYSAMTVDPIDDCTFWYTQHVAAGAGGRPTQIASFRFNNCGTDLEIVKTARASVVHAGDELLYDITVTNHGPEDAFNVTVVDTLPTAVTYINDTSSCVEAPAGTLTCDLGDIASGDSATFTVKVLVASDSVASDPDGSITITNTASVTAEQPGGDIDESNNDTAVATFVEERADLLVTKLCKPDTQAYAGEDGTCTMIVENLGVSSARNVVLTDTHVSESPFVITSATAPCAIGGATVSCSLGNLAAGSSETIAVVVNTDDAADVNDVATVTSDTPDPDPSNNQAQGSLSFAAAADLALTKAVTAGSGVAGTDVTYTLTVTNSGPSAAVNAVVEDVAPAGVSIVSVAAPGGSCSAGQPGNALLPTTCTFDSIPPAPGPSSTRSMTLVVHIDPDVVEGTILHNDARVSSDVADLNNANDQASANVTVSAEADLVLTKSDAPDPVLAGNTLTYRLTVANNGSSTAVDVNVTDSLPSEVGFVSATISNGSGTCVEFTSPPNTVSCDLNDLDPGEYVEVFIDVLVYPSVPDGTVITNTAMVTATTFDPDTDNNEVSITTTVNAEADLWMEKTGNFLTGQPSGTVQYDLTVHNDPGCTQDAPQVCGTGGPSDAQAVTVSDSFPVTAKKLRFEFASPGCVYSEATHSATCDLGTVPVGTSVTVVFQFDAKGKLGLQTNSATVSSTTTDPNGSNNTDSFTMDIKGGKGNNGGNP